MEIKNRKAKYEYTILEEIEAGIVLKGTEIKSIRNGKANIKDSYGIIRKNEIYLVNMFISHYEEGNIFNHDETRFRKLLFNKKEINKLKEKIKMEGYSLIPLKLYFNEKNKAKILIGVAKGKKKYDKRETIKKRDQEREIKKEIKYKVNSKTKWD